MESDKTLAILLIIAIVIAVIGIYLNIAKFQQVTGYASEGNVTVGITQQVTINLTDSTCNFGSGYVTAPYSYAELYFNGTSYTANNWTVSVAPTTPGIVIRNDGNVEAYVCVKPGKNTSTFFGNGTASRQFYGFWTSEKETGSCNGGRPFDNLADFSNLSTIPNGAKLCKAGLSVERPLYPQDEADEVYVNCYLKISDDTSPATKTDTWNFTAYANTGNC